MSFSGMRVAFKILLCAWSAQAMAAMPSQHAQSFPDILTRGFFAIKKSEFDPSKKEAYLKAFCDKLNIKFAALGWQKDPCSSIPWNVADLTINGNPLIYWSYGESGPVTLLISGVHPDEITPVPMGFKLAAQIKSNSAGLNQSLHRVVIAPLVNPDGFLLTKPSRVNANGVDLNRNFPTHDWYDYAIANWIATKARDQRHFPGYFPNSEIETRFQVQLIEQFAPDKIVSIHAPLGFLDYDGPGDRVKAPSKAMEQRAKHLAVAIAEKANNYRVVDYMFYPGSLGNFAGNEQNIPTITLELKTTEANKVDQYWQQFLPGLIQSIVYPFERFALMQERQNGKR